MMRCSTVSTCACVLLGLCLNYIHSVPVVQQKQLDSNGVEFSKSKTYSYTDINGAEHTKEQAEEKVSDADSHKVISDFKEKIEKSKPSPDAKTETSFRASVDIPEEGIHKEISNDDQTGQTLSDDTHLKLDEDREDKDNYVKQNNELESMKTAEFTPEDVAEFLFRTGETDEFQSLLNELVESAEISSEEAEQFEKAVMEELFKLQQRTVDVEDLETLYPQVFDEGSQSMLPLFNDIQGSNAAYPLYSYGINPGREEESVGMNNYINYLLNRPVTMEQLVNEWIKPAIESGDLKAENILGNILGQVSRDKNTNDENQVKAILGDMFAQILIDYLTPKFEPVYVETDQQKPKFIEGDEHKQSKTRPQDTSDSKETDKPANKLETQEQNSNEERFEEVKSKTDELEKELKM